MPNKYRIIIFSVIIALMGVMIYFIFLGSKNPANKLSSPTSFPPFEKTASTDPLQPIRKNATATKTDHVITVESRDPRIKPEIININQLNDELTRIGFWDKETINFWSYDSQMKAYTKHSPKGITVKSLHVIIDINKKTDEINPDLKKNNSFVHVSGSKSNIFIENGEFRTTYILHPYMLNFDYNIVGSHLSFSLLEDIWRATQQSLPDVAAGQPSSNLYALKTLTTIPEFSFIRLRK